MNFQAATKHLLNDLGLYIVNPKTISGSESKLESESESISTSAVLSKDLPSAQTNKAKSKPTIKLKSRKKLSSASSPTSSKWLQPPSKIGLNDVSRKKNVHPVAQAIYNKLQEAQKIERNISKASHKVRRLDYIHPNHFITHSQVTGLGLYSTKRLKRQAKKQNLDFFCCDLSQQKTLAGFFSKMCSDLKFPKPRGGVRGHFVKHLKLFFKKNPESQGVIIVLDNIKLKTKNSDDLYFHIRDSLDKICEGWANHPQIVRIFCSVSHGFDEKKVVHLVPFL